MAAGRSSECVFRAAAALALTLRAAWLTRDGRKRIVHL
jgi:hypothetical protein